MPLEKVKLLPWPAPTLDSPATLIMWAYTAVEDAAKTHILGLEANLKGILVARDENITLLQVMSHS